MCADKQPFGEHCWHACLKGHVSICFGPGQCTTIHRCNSSATVLNKFMLHADGSEPEQAVAVAVHLSPADVVALPDYQARLVCLRTG